MRVLLDSPHRIFFEAPIEVITANHPDQVSSALAKIESALASGRYVAGWLGYELGYALDPTLAPRFISKTPQSVPLLCLGVFDAPSSNMPALQGRAYVGPLIPEWDAAAYSERFAAVKQRIADGEIYQANLSFRTRFAFVGDAFALYEQLRDASGARHCAYVETENAGIVSISPELFFNVSADGKMTARPMKGTAPRGKEKNEDIAAYAALLSSTKDRAENVMIVDLLRNDLGRIAEIGSVQVFDLFAVETYPTLHTMVSTITARKRADVRPTDMLSALFPCGSVTGAPKIRAMEILQALESSPRGAYCGAVGYFAPDGVAHFNVAIRTLTIQNGRGELGIGGGVVQDSDPDAEYAECLLKANFLQSARQPIQLIETLRYENGFHRLDSHLARMTASARAFGLPFDSTRALKALNAAVEDKSGALRVRLTLDEIGTHLASASPLEPNPPHWKCRLADTRILSTDVLRRHKTNWRDGDEINAGIDEVLFCNERDELAEGTRSNIFLERDGVLFTPPLSAGILNGRLRAELLAQGKAREATLKPEDLNAGILYCGNSLRGLIPAILVE